MKSWNLCSFGKMENRWIPQRSAVFLAASGGFALRVFVSLHDFSFVIPC